MKSSDGSHDRGDVAVRKFDCATCSRCSALYGYLVQHRLFSVAKVNISTAKCIEFERAFSLSGGGIHNGLVIKVYQSTVHVALIPQFYLARSAASNAMREWGT